MRSLAAELVGPDEPEVAALLAAQVLTRIERLGAEAHELSLSSYFWNGIDTDPDRAAAETARLIRRSNGAMSRTPDLASSIARVLKNAHFSPIHLCYLGRSASPISVSHVFPVELLGGRTTTDLERATASSPIADAHLHSGATLSLGSLIMLGFSSREPFADDLRTTVAFDSDGRPFSVGVLYAAVVRFLQYFPRFRRGDMSGIPHQFVSGFSDGDFWLHVRQTATPSQANESLAMPWELFGVTVDRMEPGAEPLVEISGLLAEAHDGLGATSSRLVVGLLNALFLINGFLRSEHGEGLSAFVARSTRMSLFRKSVASTGRQEVIARGVRDVFSSTNVVGAEFRKTIDVPARGGVQQEILDELSDHLNAFNLSGVFAVEGRKASMPVAFRRSPAPELPLTNAALTSVHPAEPHWTLGAELIALLARLPGLAKYISAIDVVGNELDTPNWVYVPIFEQLREKLGDTLVLTAHAGEHFQWPLQGLRSVGELLLPSRVVDRIGHALALDELCSDFITGPLAPKYEVRWVIEDLCWLKAAGLFDGELEEFADVLLSSLNMAALQVTFDDFVSAWKSRRSLDGYSALALGGTSLSDSPALTLESADHWANSRGAVLAFLLLTYRGNARGFSSLDTYLNEKLAAQYTHINETHRTSIARRLLEVIKSEKVVLEACPTSNITLAGLPRARYLPIKRWVEGEITVTVNSDDPIHFSTTIVEEARILNSILSTVEAEKVFRDSVENCAAKTPSYSAFGLQAIAQSAAASFWRML